MKAPFDAKRSDFVKKIPIPQLMKMTLSESEEDEEEAETVGARKMP